MGQKWEKGGSWSFENAKWSITSERKDAIDMKILVMAAASQTCGYFQTLAKIHRGQGRSCPNVPLPDGVLFAASRA